MKLKKKINKAEIIKLQKVKMKKNKVQNKLI